MPDVNGLLLVDIQNDFMPGGALAVADADAVIAVANRLLARFPTVFATQDWHPAAHLSFAANWPTRRVGDVVELAGLEQILWPVHCVQSTPGAELARGLNIDAIHRTVHKGTCPDVDSYSGFFDNGRRHETGLQQLLEQAQVKRLFTMGVATDYCVKHTVLDACALGFETWVIEDGCRGVELASGDVARACQQMRVAGARFTTSAMVSGILASE